MKERVAIISTKDPTFILIETILALKKFYPEFDIVVIDSDSTNKEMFSHVPSYVKIEYAENKNWELGAWVYAYQKYHYKVYMFIQDSLTPTSRISSLNMFTFPEETIYSFHYHARLMDGGYLEELRHIYKDTKLHFLYELDPSTPLMGTAHTSFMTTHENVPILLQMEDAYIQKHVQKTKIHSWLSERIGGLLIDRESKKRLDLSTYFKKQHLGRN